LIEKQDCNRKTGKSFSFSLAMRPNFPFDQEDVIALGVLPVGGIYLKVGYNKEYNLSGYRRGKPV